MAEKGIAFGTNNNVDAMKVCIRRNLGLPVSSSPKKLSIVIPVYNEGASFAALWHEVTSNVRAAFEALVIYDFDEDDTVPVARRIMQQGDNRLRLIKNSVRRGVVGAMLSGFNSVESGPVLVVMADLSDDLRQVDSMLALYEQGYHVVVGSRYMRGGKMLGGPWLKKNMSKWAGRSLHLLRRLPTHDPTNAFKLYDKSMLNNFTIESQGGFEINLEITVKAFLRGYRITEIPTTWRDRSRGHSRFRLWAWLPRYFKWYIYAFRPCSIQNATGKEPTRVYRQSL